MTPIHNIVLDGDTIFVDNSGYQNVELCKRRAYYYLIRRRELDRPTSALEFGRILHEVLDVRYQFGTDFLEPKEHGACIAKMQEEFSEYSPDEGEYRNYSYMYSLFEDYMKEYPSEPFTVAKTPDGKPFIEQTFSVPLGTVEGFKIVWTGKMDLGIIRDNKFRLMDHKTASVLGPSLYSAYDLATQAWGYMFAARESTGMIPSGLDFNVIGTRKPRKDGTAQREFKRYPVQYSEEGIEEWREDILYNLAEFIANGMQDIWPRSTNNCSTKYGMCPYHEICTLPKAQREIMLGSNIYRDVVWDPLNKDSHVMKTPKQPETPLGL